MIAKDNMHLLNSTEKGWTYILFKDCVTLVQNPRKIYKMTTFIDATYQRLSVQTKEKLVAASNVTLTTDAWTKTINTIGYLGMIIFHIMKKFVR